MYNLHINVFKIEFFLTISFITHYTVNSKKTKRFLFADSTPYYGESATNNQVIQKNSIH